MDFQTLERGLISQEVLTRYKIDYEQVWWTSTEQTNTAELAQVKKNIEAIIIKNIDARISALGVSDYKAYTQNLNNETQIVVEIGGVADLDQAKKMIGKTVERWIQTLKW